jgi:hypothetical protein
MPMTWQARAGWCGAVVATIVGVLTGSAAAQSVRHVYRTAPALVGLRGLANNERYQNAADVILESAIRNLPLFPAASDAFTWRWNPTTNAYERATDQVTPWFLTERGETLGEGVLNVGITFGYYKVECSSGCRLGTSKNPLSISQAAVDYQARTDLDYSVSTLNITYGLLDDLDLNIAIPLVTLDMGLDITRQDSPGSPIRSASRQVNAANISDMMVRAKYRLFDTTGSMGRAAGAAGLRVRIPTGNPAEGLGTGFGEIGPYAALSASLLDGWLDSYWDAGVDIGIGNTRWSSAHYSWAIDIHAPRSDDWWSRLALAWSVLGRSEFTSLRASSSISGPHVTPNGIVSEPYLCADASRHDYVDTTLGVRVQVWETLVLSVGVFKAINNQGVRPADWSPVGSVEATF